MAMIVGLPSTQNAPHPFRGVPVRGVPGISNRAELESERRMVGLKPPAPPRAAEAPAEHREAA